MTFSSKLRYTVASIIIVAAILAIVVIPFFNSSLSIYVSVLAIALSLALQKYMARLRRLLRPPPSPIGT
ncbi:MAG TPA: hypothetical protein VMC84_05175 [Methanocella sp.]|uniref:hypothetical protein n=1 Tax=Methanocella sp. TaxID=2052833 RepID=UPI002BA1D6D7|nr:hypothetical protein [Methanocella sp.]HTY90550.1 hypothetical protein [Methanocella sp.]